MPRQRVELPDQSRSSQSKKVTRRSFIGGGLAAAAFVASGSFDHAISPDQGRIGVDIDQNPVRRRGTGLRALDVERASPGLTLFAPIGGDGTVYLIDLHGKVVHSWKMPYPPGLYGYLTEKGTLLYNGKTSDTSYLGKKPYKGGVVLEADWNGRVLREARHQGHHHDGRLLENGNVILLSFKELPANVQSKVTGGRAGTEASGIIWGDYLVEIAWDGRTVWEWNTWDHLDPVKEVITAPQDDRAEWTHANAVVELDGGDLLVSFRNTSKIIRINRKDGGIVWELGAPPLSGQHAPVPLPNGNILIFDNGPHRLDNSLTFSRVIEIEPATNRVAWSYQEAVPFNFYSPRLSNAQRLPNGNTLINEGLFGRFFEVTSDGKVVWEYVNPFFGPADSPPSAQSNSVFRAYRYTEEEIDNARRKR